MCFIVFVVGDWNYIVCFVVLYVGQKDVVIFVVVVVEGDLSDVVIINGNLWILIIFGIGCYS